MTIERREQEKEIGKKIFALTKVAKQGPSSSSDVIVPESE